MPTIYRWGFDKNAIELAVKAASPKVTAVKISGASIWLECSSALNPGEQTVVNNAVASAFDKLVKVPP